jgi:O-acetyl-ADP-ribose deacetylase (regulator of RNase III)
MKLILTDRNVNLVQEWQKYFRAKPGWEVEVKLDHSINLDDTSPTTVYVSPANSFLYMDGGIDLIYARRFPSCVKLGREHVQHYGEVPVGDAEVYRLAEGPSMIWAPTMRVPENVANTVNAYLAFRSVLPLAVAMHARTVICPGFCTGIGKMTGRRAAFQMNAAWEDFHRIDKDRDHLDIWDEHRWMLTA